MQRYQQFFGRIENKDAADRLASKIGESHIRCRHLGDARQEKVDIGLWLPLKKVLPGWTRGQQLIGDCVGWGGELACTMLMALKHVKGMGSFIAQAATEALYAGSRVEAGNDGRPAGYRDGSYGAALVEWLTGWGVLVRKDYSEITGDPSHDLRVYSGDRAKDWGNYGCGGRRDARGDGPLDKIAREMPVVDAVRVTDVMSAAYALQNGYPIVVCSNVGYEGMRRNSDGVVRRNGTWYHCMMFGGVRWRNGSPFLRQFQSWGPESCSGPDPGINDDSISGCSWWTTPEDAEAQLRQGDSYILSDIEGMPLQKLPTAEMAGAWDLSA